MFGLWWVAAQVRETHMLHVTTLDLACLGLDCRAATLAAQVLHSHLPLAVNVNSIDSTADRRDESRSISHLRSFSQSLTLTPFLLLLHARHFCQTCATRVAEATQFARKFWAE
jgi:hypothetical protein